MQSVRESGFLLKGFCWGCHYVTADRHMLHRSVQCSSHDGYSNKAGILTFGSNNLKVWWITQTYCPQFFLPTFLCKLLVKHADDAVKLKYWKKVLLWPCLPTFWHFTVFSLLVFLEKAFLYKIVKAQFIGEKTEWYNHYLLPLVYNHLKLRCVVFWLPSKSLDRKRLAKSLVLPVWLVHQHVVIQQGGWERQSAELHMWRDAHVLN